MESCMPMFGPVAGISSPCPSLFLPHTCTHIEANMYLFQLCILSRVTALSTRCNLFLMTFVLKFSKFQHNIRILIGTYLLQYYTDPRSGYKFRSKKDVLRYLETGEISRNAFKPKESCINNEELINSEISVSLHLCC